MAEDVDGRDPIEVRTQPVQPALDAGKRSVFGQPGFGWGLAVGMFAILLLAVVSAGLFAFLSFGAVVSDQSSPRQSVTLEPVKAGSDWFTIGSDGTGVLEGWPSGSMSSGDGSWSGPEPQYSFEIAEVGAIGDMPIKHAVSVGVDKNTEFFVGDARFEPKGNRTVLETLFGEEGTGSPIFDGQMRLKVEFRRQGDWLMATKVTADPNGGPPPEFFNY